MKEAKLFLMMALVCAMPLAYAGAGGDLVGDEACAGCHEELVASFDKSFHSTFFKKGDNFRCEACHGSGQAHMDNEDPTLIAGPENNMKKLEQNCLSCHSNVVHGLKEKHVMEYGVGCTDCHKVHQPAYKGSLAEYEDQLCLKCHQDIKAKMYLPSHHPVKEGRMTCIDCHKFDGSEDVASENTMPERVNETCLSCHPQYRGPFVFEHAPVAENCLICHDPHGSVANNLLKANEPFLCLQCHQMHFHTALPGYEGEFTPRNHPDRGPFTSTRTGQKRAFLTKCTQCHTMIHGSDLPSEARSAQGKALTR